MSRGAVPSVSKKAASKHQLEAPSAVLRLPPRVTLAGLLDRAGHRAGSTGIPTIDMGGEIFEVLRPAIVRLPAGSTQLLTARLPAGCALIFVVRSVAAPPAPFPDTRLTHRETQVAALLVERRTNSEIATALGISAHTARHHVQRILDKLGAANRRQVTPLLSAQHKSVRGKL